MCNWSLMRKEKTKWALKIFKAMMVENLTNVV